MIRHRSFSGLLANAHCPGGTCRLAAKYSHKSSLYQRLLHQQSPSRTIDHPSDHQDQASKPHGGESSVPVQTVRHWTEHLQANQSDEAPNSFQVSWTSVLCDRPKTKEPATASSSKTKKKTRKPSRKDSLKEREKRSHKKETKKRAKAPESSEEKAARPRKKPRESSEEGATKKSVQVKVLRSSDLELCPIEDEAKPDVPKLSYNLDRVLFNPGVYQIQDPRTRVFNFDPYLASIMPVEEFDYGALKAYITSSKDNKLRQLTADHGLKYCGSTSSMTALLSHLHYLLSAWRPVNMDTLSSTFTPDSYNFTQLTRAPSTAFARLEGGVYAIDADKSYDSENVLSTLGKSMEKLLTLPKEGFERYRKTRSHQITEEERNASEAYHYTTFGDFMLRSQLDAHDPRLPGTGMFDLKTRAVVAIRMDVQGYEKGRDYEIRSRFGQWESFEREYFDMIRSAFLKYSLQVRMGRMDGIFVAFHNTRRIFGFQYISLSEMDQALHGTADTRLGDMEFKYSLALLNDLLNRATERFPGRTLRIHVETRPTKIPLMYFFAQPVSEEEISKSEEASEPMAEELEQTIRRKFESNMDDVAKDQEETGEEVEEGTCTSEEVMPEDEEPTAEDVTNGESTSHAAWQELMTKVEETVENESLGIESVRDAIQRALDQHGLFRDLTESDGQKCLDDLVAVMTAHVLDRAEPQEQAEEEEQDVSQHEESPEPLSIEEAQQKGNSLTDLILKVTEKLDEEKRNLKDLQRMFADLATQSKQQEASGEAASSQLEAIKNETPDEQLAASARADELTKKQETDTDEPAVETSETAKESELDGPADTKPESETASTPETESADGELLGLCVTIRNMVGDRVVERPEKPEPKFDWTIEYAIQELSAESSHHIYGMVKRRRQRAFTSDPETKDVEWHKIFGGTLPIASKRGREFRRRRAKEEADNPILVAWDTKPLQQEPSGSADKKRSGDS
ncbi:hypothetical protein HIM_08839 [Hirsutella minnesotensis 3608]|uniref:Uncharacterized protein n=1 Tax=Hirsutella minnesotensis 3608 TaxID=1043627 RepID=A0A0F8A3F8_9HYPO|nr:hypothetical protein HIM_08839 [Hirsutella minnesotensis 3608]